MVLALDSKFIKSTDVVKFGEGAGGGPSRTFPPTACGELERLRGLCDLAGAELSRLEAGAAGLDLLWSRSQRSKVAVRLGRVLRLLELGAVGVVELVDRLSPEVR